jgi:hypothetical protein
LGQNCVTIDEAKMVFRYLDADQEGEIGCEAFKDIIHEERAPKKNQLPESFPERFAGISYSTLEPAVPIKQEEIGRNDTLQFANNWRTESQKYGMTGSSAAPN